MIMGMMVVTMIVRVTVCVLVFLMHFLSRSFPPRIRESGKRFPERRVYLFDQLDPAFNSFRSRCHSLVPEDLYYLLVSFEVVDVVIDPVLQVDPASFDVIH